MHVRESHLDEKYATLDEAIDDIKVHDYEESAYQGGGKFCCLRCNTNLKGEYYYHQFNYPFTNMKLWKMCRKCFSIIKSQFDEKS